jgi:hypothetical protein
MDINKFYGFKKMLEKDSILYSYSGLLSQGLIEEIGIVLKAKMNAEEATPTLTQKIFSVFIEQVQNIMTFSQENEIENDNNAGFREGVVAIGKENANEMFVISGNAVSIGDKEKISQMIDKINQMDKDNLKSLYKEQLKNNTDITKRSAGLGLIDMARKSSKPISYYFEPLPNECAYFIIKVVI